MSIYFSGSLISLIIFVLNSCGAYTLLQLYLAFLVKNPQKANKALGDLAEALIAQNGTFWDRGKYLLANGHKISPLKCLYLITYTSA